ncbi:YlbL family protein [Streptomyces aidingensis]|uniref:endopeptidase La n=1 Tax=Streptomyces aidingensis TaxID=910347 RepID=A0A1I1EZC3_9ACTN|nr:PDZ domain-containing protein [Streptomyces aidingensis]SFB92076.1 PDZ domain-containing protein [Streptomyces aidingensis]
MSRRSASLLTSGLLLIGLLFAAVLIRVPYAEMSPGPTVNTLGDYRGSPVLSIEGEQTHETSGHLNMTTVRVTGVNYRMSLAEAVMGWLSYDAAVIPHETLYPDERSADEVEQQNAEEFSRSQETAKVAALRELGYELETEIIVSAVVDGGPAEGRLHAGDVIVAVDGTKVTEQEQVAELVTAHRAGEEVVLTVEREPEDAEDTGDARDGGRERLDVTITTEPAEDDGRALIGVQVGLGYVFPFEIDIELADVGGPSAGLMFALGLIDKLTEEDLTGGTFVAGTGTIDEDGTIGPIGGVTMKTIAARDKGAEYFLTPAGNCLSAAADPPGGLTLVKVETLDDALAALESIRGGDLDALPRCD